MPHATNGEQVPPHAPPQGGGADDPSVLSALPLSALPVPALRERWIALYGSAPPPRMSRELLVQAIAYRTQER